MKISLKGGVLFLTVCVCFMAYTSEIRQNHYLAGQSIFSSTQEDKNPYLQESYVNRKYEVLQHAYNLDEEFASRTGPQSVLLIGVGRGYAALEMALKYPNLTITAVNKEDNLFNAREISDYFKMTYSPEKVDEALSRIIVKIEDVERVAMVPQKDTYDVIVFETNVLMYIRDKLATVEYLFNSLLKKEGALFFETDDIYGAAQTEGFADRAVEPHDIFDYVYEELSDKGHSMSDTKIVYFDESHNLRFFKRSDRDVKLPLQLHRELTAVESLSHKRSSKLTVDSSVAPFISVYLYAKRSAASAVSISS